MAQPEPVMDDLMKWRLLTGIVRKQEAKRNKVKDGDTPIG
jgi:hypothetical protein